MATVVVSPFVNQSVQSADYTLASDGTTVTAYDKTGAVAASGADGGAVLAAILPAANSAGLTIAFRNDGNPFPWGSVPGIPPGITRKLLLQGNGATIALSAAGGRFLDFARTADYQTFQHVEVADFVINATARTDAATHAIIGSKTGGTTPDQRVNFLDIVVRRIRCFGLATGTSIGVYISTIQLAGGEGTPNTIKDVLIEDVAIDGGVAGFVVTGGPAGAITNLNMLYDNIRIIRCKQTQSAAAVVGGSGTAACVEIGQNCPGGYVLVRDFYGEYSGDVGIEIDNATHADIEDCVIANTKNAYYMTNYAPPQKPNGQSYRYSRCRATVSDAAVNAASHAFTLAVHNAVALGEAHYDRCVFFQDNNVLSTTNSPQMLYLSGALTMQRLEVTDCEMNVEAINWNNAANSEPVRGLNIGNGATVTKLIVRHLRIRGAGTISGAGAVAFRGIGCEGSSFTGEITVDGLTLDWNITGVGGAGVTRGILLGPGAASTISGSIRGVHVVSLGSDTAAVAIRVGSTANLTISPGPIVITDCNFAAIPTGGNEVTIDATQAALGAILTTGNRWKTKPAPVGFTGLVTATGKKLGAQAATVFWPAMVTFAQGSGTADTAIDYSTNDGTTYTNFLTQASGALPAGFDQSLGPLMPADLVKVTFTGTQPTITLVPVNP